MEEMTAHERVEMYEEAIFDEQCFSSEDLRQYEQAKRELEAVEA